jgi:hypothetical protein
VTSVERFRMLFDVHFGDVTASEVDRWGFAVLDELIDLDGVIDADLTADLGRRRVWYDFLVDAADVTEALTLAVAAFRTALHAAGVATPGMDLQVAASDVDREPAGA